MRVFLFAAVLFFPSALFAQSSDEAAGVTFAMRTFNAVSVVAPPPWLETPDLQNLEEHAEISRKQGKSPSGSDVFIMEWVPKGETFEAWNRLYALMAETETTGDAEAHRNQVAQVYNQACKAMAFQPVIERLDSQLFLLFCPSYQGTPGQGEIAVMHYRMAGRTLVKNYYHVRGPAFDMSSQQSWPVYGAELDAAIKALARFELVPPQ